MPLPKALARFNHVATNRVARHVAGRLPGFAIVSHTGRTSGRVHRTPVNLFRDGDRHVIALMYGADSQWVRNVLAVGACEVEAHGERIGLERPELVHDPERTLVPPPIRPILRALRVSDFLVLSPRSTTPSGSA